jgi:hypothetical protein
VLRQLSFRRLTRRTFVVTSIIALAFMAFAWAANPAKDQPRVVPALEKQVDVNPNDTARLGKILGPTCVDAKLHVIVLGEWRSGVQEVVTVPNPSCHPVRLRLDHGRFSESTVRAESDGTAAAGSNRSLH